LTAKEPHVKDIVATGMLESLSLPGVKEGKSLAALLRNDCGLGPAAHGLRRLSIKDTQFDVECLDVILDCPDLRTIVVCWGQSIVSDNRYLLTQVLEDRGFLVREK
jgi:hypothetical protein